MEKWIILDRKTGIGITAALLVSNKKALRLEIVPNGQRLSQIDCQDFPLAYRDPNHSEVIARLEIKKTNSQKLLKFFVGEYPEKCASRRSFALPEDIDMLWLEAYLNNFGQSSAATIEKIGTYGEYGFAIIPNF